MTKVSGDLMVKLGVGAVVLLAGFLALRKAAGVASSAAGAVLDGINPASTNNVIYRLGNYVGGGAIPNPEGPGKNADGSWTLGGFIYDISHPEVVAQVREVTKPINVSGNQITVTPDPVSNSDSGINFNYF